MLATCPEETKSVLIDELHRLGAVHIISRYCAVEFTCSEDVYYRVHLGLRSASRLLRVLKEFSAKSPNMLFDQARRLPWDRLFSEHNSFRVDGVIADRGEEFMRSNDISKRVREAIEMVFTRSGKRVPRVDLKDTKVVVIAYVHKGRCTLSIDTSGKTLHKRGFRVEGGHPAPLKETLAASVLSLSGYDGAQVLLDPMCGTGTIGIEAALISPE